MTTSNQPLCSESDRGGSQDVLRISQEQYHYLVECAGSVILRVDKDMKITFMNTYGLEFLGYLARDVIGRSALETIIPQRDDNGVDMVAMAHDIIKYPDRYATNVHQNRRKDGSLVWMSWTNKAIYGADGGLAEILSVGNDLTRLKETEEALQSAHRQTETILQSITDAFFALDRQWRFTYVNPESERLLRKSAKELLGNCVWDLFPQAEGFRRQYEQAIRTQAAATFEEYYEPFDAWFEVRAYPSPKGLSVYYRDVTDRKHAQDAMREANAQLEQKVAQRTAELSKASQKTQAERQRFFDVLETLPVMITLIRPDYHVPFANRAYRQALGEAKGRTCYNYQFGRDKPCDECEAFKPLKTGKPHQWEWTLPTGRTFEIHNFPFTDADGSPMILEMDIDITDRRQAEAKVAAERKRLYDVLDTLPVYVILLDADHRVPFANRFFEERFGQSGGRRCYDYLFNLSEPCDTCETYKVLKTGANHHWYWTGPDNRDYDIYDFPFKDSDGSDLILEMGIDITEQVRAQTGLKEAKETLEKRVAERTEELARSNKELEAFAYLASHDLQEPLRMVNQFMKLLQERCKNQLDDKAHEYIAYAVDGATRMSDLIRDLLEYSRIDRTGRRRARSSAGHALNLAMANLRNVIHETSAEITHDDLPDVQADATQLMQLFQNLVGNAIKFRRKGVTPRIHVGASRDANGRHFWVKDNGIGIDPSQHERIFHIFQRLHGRDEYPGTGIGLAVCKKIVEQHDGKIWVESKPGEGATFHFVLPE